MKGIIYLQSKFKAQSSVLSHILTYVALFFIYSYPHEFDLVCTVLPLAVDTATQRHSCCTTFKLYRFILDLKKKYLWNDWDEYSVLICFLF